jgi:hypothetical protein
MQSTTAWNFSTASTTTDDYPYSTDTPGRRHRQWRRATGVIEVPDDADLFRVELAGVAYYLRAATRQPAAWPTPTWACSTRRSPQWPKTTTAPAPATRASLHGGHQRHPLPGGGRLRDGTGAYTLQRHDIRLRGTDLGGNRTPADDANAVAVGADLVLNFSEAVLAGSGSIRIYNSATVHWCARFWPATPGRSASAAPR